MRVDSGKLGLWGVQIHSKKDDSYNNSNNSSKKSKGASGCAIGGEELWLAQATRV